MYYTQRPPESLTTRLLVWLIRKVWSIPTSYYDRRAIWCYNLFLATCWITSGVGWLAGAPWAIFTVLFLNLPAWIIVWCQVMQYEPLNVN